MRSITIIFVLLTVSDAVAETIRFEANGQAFDIEFVEIGSPGNPADVDERYPGQEKTLGSVDYLYSVSKFEASCEGYNIFTSGQFLCRENYPADTSPYSMIGYVNWLNEIQGYPHAYNDPELDETGNVIPNIVRNSRARFFVTSADEWHKAAYYDPVAKIYYDYATGSDTRPTSVAQGTEPNTAILQAFTGIAPAQLAGGPSPYGTIGQTGNIHEIEENLLWYRWGSNSFGQPEAHLARVSAHELTGGVGFRLVSVPPVPEPSTGVLAAFGLLAILAFGRSTSLPRNT